MTENFFEDSNLIMPETLSTRCVLLLFTQEITGFLLKSLYIFNYNKCSEIIKYNQKIDIIGQNHLFCLHEKIIEISELCSVSFQ